MTTRRKTNESFIQQVYERHNGQIECLEPYTLDRNRHLFKCLICFTEWTAIANNVIKKNGTGCPKCAKNIKKTHDEYVKQIDAISNNTVSVEEPYINDASKILHKCNICSTAWSVKPNNMLHYNSGCPRCARWRVQLMHSGFTEITAPIVSWVYLIKFETETEIFVKIGWTAKGVLSRCKDFPKEYTITVLQVREGSALDMYNLEQDLLAKYKQFQYVPEIHFNGRTECFYAHEGIILE